MPNKNKYLAIVIPVFNEGRIIRDVIKGLPKKLKGISKIVILAVNDGSDDNSDEEINKTNALLINHPINLGAGSATVTGIEAAKKLGCDIVVTFDGDGQHDPSDIEKVIRPIVEEKADLVIGTRLKNPKGMPHVKRFGNWGLNFATYLLSRKWTTDSQSGFKAFSREAIKKINIDSIGYEFCSEMIMQASQKKLKIKEVSIKVIYTTYSKKKGQNILNGVNILLKLMLKKIAG